MNLIFLDIDGVLNCEVFFKDRPKGSYVEQMICRERVSWLNELCEEIQAQVVVSSTWRMGRTVEELQEIFNEVGGTFKVIGKTPHLKHEGCVRGNEIAHWIKENTDTLYGIPYYDFKSYVIIDDDSDMLLGQANHFFHVDHYAGLTPNTCYKIKRFFGAPTFSNTHIC